MIIQIATVNIENMKTSNDINNIMEWLEDNKDIGITILPDGRRGRNLIEVIIRLTKTIESPIEKLDFLVWVKDRMSNSSTYIAPEIMSSEWSRVQHRLDRSFPDPDKYKDLWDIWSGKL